MTKNTLLLLERYVLKNHLTSFLVGYILIDIMVYTPWCNFFAASQLPGKSIFQKQKWSSHYCVQSFQGGWTHSTSIQNPKTKTLKCCGYVNDLSPIHHMAPTPVTQRFSGAARSGSVTAPLLRDSDVELFMDSPEVAILYPMSGGCNREMSISNKSEWRHLWFYVYMDKFR